jgi:hypothetical protein
MHYIPGLCPECNALSWVYELEQDYPSSSQKKIDLMKLAHMGVYNYELGIAKM